MGTETWFDQDARAMVDTRPALVARVAAVIGDSISIGETVSDPASIGWP